MVKEMLALRKYKDDNTPFIKIISNVLEQTYSMNAVFMSYFLNESPKKNEIEYNANSDFLCSYIHDPPKRCSLSRTRNDQLVFRAEQKRRQSHIGRALRRHRTGTKRQPFGQISVRKYNEEMVNESEIQTKYPGINVNH